MKSQLKSGKTGKFLIVVTALVIAVAAAVIPFPRKITLTKSGFSLGGATPEMTISIDVSYWRSLWGYERIDGSVTVNSTYSYNFTKGVKTPKIDNILCAAATGYNPERNRYERCELYFSDNFTSFICKTDEFFFAAPAETKEEAEEILRVIREKVWVE